ncbi:hypothetical protein Tco_0899634 [Tanacetum coccineum]
MAFPHLQELAVAQNSNNLTDAMSVYIERKINDDLHFAAGLSHLWELSQTEVLKMLEIWKSIAEVHMQVHKKIDFITVMRTQILHQLIISNVEHVDNLRFNLLSVGQICDNKCRVTFTKHDSEITKDGKVIGRVIMEYLVNIRKRHAFWSLNEDILKITILTTNTPYPSRKIRRICACTHQRPRRTQDQYTVS